MKYINQHFFDNESREMYYVLDNFYGGYIPYGKSGITFRDSSRDLVQIVMKDNLKSEHTITQNRSGTNSYFITIQNLPYLRSKLDSLGLDVPKYERKFPIIKEELYISNFVRGFFDVQACIRLKNNLTIITLVFNSEFLIPLNETKRGC